MTFHDNFPQFARLPLEIRRLIWQACLPRRIAEEDVPYSLLDGKCFRQACWPNRTTFQNARVPLLASVNHEARRTVFEWGHYQKSDDYTSLSVIWLQPKVDGAIHLNWTRDRNLQFYVVHDAYIPSYDETPVFGFICRARYEYDTRISLVADLIYPFDLGELMAENSPVPDIVDRLSTSNSATASPLIPGLHLSDSLDEHALDVEHAMLYAEDQFVFVTLVAISLHVDRGGALKSGLFGLQGDATVQTVDFDDVPRLRKFRDLYDSDLMAKGAEPHVDRLFHAVLSPCFRAAVLSWWAKARWLLQVATWKWMRKFYPETFGSAGPESAWQPLLPKELHYIRMDEHMPDKDCPWWKEHAEQNTPRLVPQVMIRLCDNQCYKEEMRPEKFGELWFDSNSCDQRSRP